MNMDPDCAICSMPAAVQCECEAKGLDIAVRQAEQRMMTNVYREIQTWVRGHAQDYILSYFTMLTARRRELHAAEIQRIHDRAWHYYHAQPHPSEITNVDMDLKRGIDEDWKASVQRYPEVLEYFYSLVDLSLPGDDEPNVRDPPMSALGGGKQRVRLRDDGAAAAAAAAAAATSGGRRRSRVNVERVNVDIEPIPEMERRREGRRPNVQFDVPYSYVHPGAY